MTDDESKETSEDQPEEPVAEQGEGTSEEPSQPASSAPSEETHEAEQDDAEPPAAEAELSTPAEDGENQPEANDDPSLTPSEEAEGPDGEAESRQEEPAEAVAAQDEAPVEEPEAEKTPEKKKDVIPGADLEPIAVEADERPLSAEERARLEAEEEERANREAELVGGAEEEPTTASRAPAKMESGARYLATGKRKRSIARVTLLPGDGKIEINERDLEEFFPRPLHQTMARQPLAITGYEASVDVRVRVHGGGVGGQAGAVRHGIARALTEIDPELRGELKRRGFLTRDARVKERRKAGLKKARKRPQFSKR
jgi:small subunit ribosomal protein S9